MLGKICDASSCGVARRTHIDQTHTVCEARGGFVTLFADGDGFDGAGPDGDGPHGGRKLSGASLHALIIECDVSLGDLAIPQWSCMRPVS